MPVESDVESYTEPDSLDNSMDEYKSLFFTETKEHLRIVNDCLLAYEKHPSDISHIEELFRSVHTIKGSSAMMGYDDISHIAHSLEDVFDLALKGTKVSSEVIELFFQVFDAMETHISDLEKGAVNEINCDELVDKIQNSFATIIEPPAGADDKTGPQNRDFDYDKYKIKSIESIRVKTSELDKLMNLVGELVINKSQLNQVPSQINTSNLKHSINNIDRISADLQNVVTRIRMVPVGNVFNRFPRLVRDLSLQKNKQINLIIDGSDIELDRKILEEIGEPLIHLLRNAVDHGIELPEERENQGKKREGTINIKAERSQDHILISVQDDGAGIDPLIIKDKAIRENWVSDSELNGMTNKQLINLIMVNGFSTASDVTEVSGRGVGMNIVKTKIEAMGGSIVITSEVGKGTQFLLKLPLTLSIIKSMLIEVCGDTYAIPLNYIEEMVSVDKVHKLGKIDAIQLREQSINIFHLRDLLNLPGTEKKVLHILIIINEEEKFGLVVDSIIGMREIMTKKVSDSLQSIKGISGVTILGDGQVIIVLDPLDLFNR